MVWDGQTNVTNKVGFALSHGHSFQHGEVLVTMPIAKHLADAWNEWAK
jgi:hypothetical protein